LPGTRAAGRLEFLFQSLDLPSQPIPLPFDAIELRA
jgi:hypothetical protein